MRPIADGLTEAGVGMRIVFGLISSHEGAGPLAQLIDALAPHRVVLHHDPQRAPLLGLMRPNLLWVPDAQPTGWGSFSFVQAILRTLRFARDQLDFDYFQLLSPSCLPIRPLADLHQHLQQDRASIHADLMSVRADDDTFMTFGYRIYLPAGGLRFRMLRRVRGWYFGPEAELVQHRSLSMHRRERRPLLTAAALGGHAGRALTRLAANGVLGHHPFGPARMPHVGSTWFGARREAAERLLQMSLIEPWRSGFARHHLLDETLLPTMLAQTGCPIGESHHAVSDFDRQGHPRTIRVEDLAGLQATGRFFARKFALQTQDPARRLAIEWSGGDPAPVRESARALQGPPTGTPRLSIQPM